jgi:hypothetical protein
MTIYLSIPPSGEKVQKLPIGYRSMVAGRPQTWRKGPPHGKGDFLSNYRMER